MFRRLKYYEPELPVLDPPCKRPGCDGRLFERIPGRLVCDKCAKPPLKREV